MKNIYTEFQANFIKHAEDAKRFLYGEFTYGDEDYKYFTEDGIVVYIVPKSMWWINDTRAAQKGGEASKSTSESILTQMKQCIPVRKIGTEVNAKKELIVLESYDKSLKLYADPKNSKSLTNRISSLRHITQRVLCLSIGRAIRARFFTL